MTVRLLILVQERTFADALATRLEAEPDMEIVAALHTRAPSAHLFTGSRADVVLLDADFPDTAAFDLCQELSQRGEGPQVILLSQPSDPARIIRGVGAGAAGWVRKDESLDRLIEVIYGVARGETWLPTGDTGEVLRLLLRRPDEGLVVSGKPHLRAGTWIATWGGRGRSRAGGTPEAMLARL